MAAANSYPNSGSGMGPYTKTYIELLMQVPMSRTTPVSLRSAHNNMLATFWQPDFTRCNAHACVAESVGMYDLARYNTMCGMCLRDDGGDAANPLGFRYTGDPARGKPDLDATRERWLAARNELAQTTRALLVKNKANAETGAVEPVPLPVRRAERDAWVQYLVLVLERVRPAVVHGYETKCTAKSHSDYVAYLRQFESDACGRRDRKGGDITLSWCQTHNRVCHMLPMLGAGAYHPDCGQCPKALPARDDGRGLDLDEAAQRADDVDAAVGRLTAAGRGSTGLPTTSSFSLAAEATSH